MLWPIWYDARRHMTADPRRESSICNEARIMCFAVWLLLLRYASLLITTVAVGPTVAEKTNGEKQPNSISRRSVVSGVIRHIIAAGTLQMTLCGAEDQTHVAIKNQSILLLHSYLLT